MSYIFYSLLNKATAKRSLIPAAAATSGGHMKKNNDKIRLLPLLVLVLLSLTSNTLSAKDNYLTLCWAKWDPADALVELSREFTTKTGIEMRYEFEPWTSFTARFKKSLNAGSKECDLIIGDSQWLGGGAENGHYVKLNEFLNRENISMDEFVPATVEAYSAWPKGTDNYWAIPAMGDAVGWTYRQDWFTRDDIKAEFQAQHGWSLERPRNWYELITIAKFFQGKVIDGKKVYGAAIYTEGGAEGITMGYTSAFYSWGASYHNPQNPREINGYVNSKEAVDALEFYKQLYDCCTPPGHSNAYMLANLDSYKKGEVAMHMNFFAFFPGIATDPNVGGEKSGFFVNPEHHVAASTLGGQGLSVVSYSNKRDMAYQYLKWFSEASTQKKWWLKGGYAVHKSVLENPYFSTTRPFAEDFLNAMNTVQDFWQSPDYEDLLSAMQKRVHNYVVGNQGSAQDALDNLVLDWQRVFNKSRTASR